MADKGVARRVPIRILLATAVADEPVTVTGWVKTARFSKNVSFVHLFDGSGAKTVQVVLTAEQAERFEKHIGIGASLRVGGRWVRSQGGEQAFEVAASEVEILGTSDPAEYPLQKKRTSLEHLRTIAHLRPRTNTFQSVFRVRNQLCWQIHKFYQERGFLWVHTPIISGSDAEGAGEMFAVQAGDTPEAFFGRPTYLTVSGQLQGETFAQAFTDIYTFGPTFRAENSNTKRHAAEFWMIEPEIAFADLDDLVALAEDFVRAITIGTIEACADDFAFFSEWVEKGVAEKVLETVRKPFARVTYTEAQEILAKSGRTFEYPIGWGQSLQAEHERFLAEEHFDGPVFVTDYPVEQKAFYMRLNDDNKTVACTDLLVPRIGEIIGGSQREERLETLDWQIRRIGMNPEDYGWYRDLRRYGTTRHAGFGLGLERALMWMTGMQNIRDVIPYPRTPGSADF